MAEHQNRSVAVRRTIDLLLAIICVAFTVFPLTLNPAMADPVADGLAAYQRGDYPAAYYTSSASPGPSTAIAMRCS